MITDYMWIPLAVWRMDILSLLNHYQRKKRQIMSLRRLPAGEGGEKIVQEGKTIKVSGNRMDCSPREAYRNKETGEMFTYPEMLKEWREKYEGINPENWAVSVSLAYEV